MSAVSDLLHSLPLDTYSLYRRFGPSTVDKAKGIVSSHQVLETRLTEEAIEGLVQGTSMEPYRQTIYFPENPRDICALALCSCPVGRDCKHVAAVLLTLARNKELIEAKPPDLTPKIGEYRPPLELENWVSSVVRAATPQQTEYPPDAPQKLLYILEMTPLEEYSGGLSVRAVSVKLLKNGTYGGQSELKTAATESGSFARYILDSDRPILTSLHRQCERKDGFGRAQYRLKGTEGERFLRTLVATGRVFWGSVQAGPLKLAEPRKAHSSWREDAMGTQHFSFMIDGGGLALPLIPPWYVDPTSLTMGLLDTEMPPAVAEKMLHAPAVTMEQAHYVHAALGRAFPNLPVMAPDNRRPPEVRIVEPIPVFSLFTVEATESGWARKTTRRKITAGRLSFLYEGAKIRRTGRAEELRLKSPEGITLYPRDYNRERLAERRLAHFGWSEYHPGMELPPGFGNDYILDAQRTPPHSLVDPIIDFVFKGAEQLRREGWQIEVASDVAGEIIEAPDWDVQVNEPAGVDWFSVQLGATVEGERIDLAPVLARVFYLIRARGGFNIERLNDDGEPMLVRMDDGRIIPLPIKRLKPLLRTLVQLYGEPDNWGELKRLPKWRILDIDTLEQGSEGLTWSGGDRLRKTAAQLSNFEKIGPVEEPSGFVGTLRDYQKHGLAWFQFLREFEFGGILADDMGLGKTIQTLAHLLKEKQEGRADLPSLLVAPTSTLPNWAAEAAKFAPELKVLILRSADRKKRLAQIDTHDLVVTTYSLLPRDKEEILRRKYHLMILDEAQNVKNPKVAAAFLARQVAARQRICLSGTPVENHLGELWSLLQIVMPGLLGDEAQFKQRFRTPIEKLNDKAAQIELSRRIRPFMLRRTKGQVASELPPKTEIIEIVEFEGQQRDLYETVRAAMDKRVRDALEQQGLGKSHIIILDALLKLRQICCDPRLVKIDAARDVKESAKLHRLMEMLPELIEDGRRILLFSQFTSMLELIEASLGVGKIPYVKLTGETKDRAAPVAKFQNKEVPLFLISLKAGGTGLNLTAADAVIHYDPWWNPAVERQATDRAHRIGQTQPVFVYKLVAQGTVEEKILELQARKGALADALLDPSALKVDINKEDLQWIFGK